MQRLSFLSLSPIRLAIIVGSAIGADMICTHLRIPERTTHEVALFVIMFGALVSSKDEFWPKKFFWVLAVGLLSSFLIMLFILIDRLLPGMSFAAISIICLAGTWCVGKVISRILGRNVH